MTEDSISARKRAWGCVFRLFYPAILGGFAYSFIFERENIQSFGWAGLVIGYFALQYAETPSDPSDRAEEFWPPIITSLLELSLFVFMFTALLSHPLFGLPCIWFYPAFAIAILIPPIARWFCPYQDECEYLSRYALWTVLGAAAAFCLLLAWIFPNAGTEKLAFAVCFFAFVVYSATLFYVPLQQKLDRRCGLIDTIWAIAILFILLIVLLILVPLKGTLSTDSNPVSTPPPEAPVDTRTYFVGSINFRTGKSAISKAGRRKLEALRSELGKCRPGETLERTDVFAFADPRTPEKNSDLAKNRASAVRRTLGLVEETKLRNSENWCEGSTSNEDGEPVKPCNDFESGPTTKTDQKTVLGDTAELFADRRVEIYNVCIPQIVKKVMPSDDTTKNSCLGAIP